MTYLLDTNVAIAILRNRPLSVRERFDEVTRIGLSVAVSAVVVFELWYGVAKSADRRQNAERLRLFLSGPVDTLPFEDQDAIAAGNLRAELEVRGTPIGPYDLMIAAQALRRDTILVTANVSEFARVPGLAWEDWTAPKTG